MQDQDKLAKTIEALETWLCLFTDATPHDRAIVRQSIELLSSIVGPLDLSTIDCGKIPAKIAGIPLDSF
jgi:hypothetical protein